MAMINRTTTISIREKPRWPRFASKPLMRFGRNIWLQNGEEAYIHFSAVVSRDSSLSRRWMTPTTTDKGELMLGTAGGSTVKAGLCRQSVFREEIRCPASAEP